MLEVASAPPPKPALNPALAAEAGRGGKEQAGFQDLLRDALEAPPPEVDARQPVSAQIEADGNAPDQNKPETQMATPRQAESMPMTVQEAGDIAASLATEPGAPELQAVVQAFSLTVLADQQPKVTPESPAVPMGGAIVAVAQADAEQADAGTQMASGQKGQPVAALQANPLAPQAVAGTDGLAQAGLAAEQQAKPAPSAGVQMALGQQDQSGAVRQAAALAPLSAPGSDGAVQAGLAAEQPGKTAPSAGTQAALSQEGQPVAMQSARLSPQAAPVSDGVVQAGLAAEQPAKSAPTAGMQKASVQEGQSAAMPPSSLLPSVTSPASDEVVLAQTPVLPLAAQPGLAGPDAPENVLAQQAASGLAAAPVQAAALQASRVSQVQAGGRKATVTVAEGAAAAENRVSPMAQLVQALGAKEAAPEVKIILAAETAEAPFRLTGKEAPKPVTALPQAEGNAEAPSSAALGFMLPDGGLQRADAALQGAPLREAPAPPPARQLVPVVVSLALRGGGDEALTIALEPGELGRVEVSIGQGKEAGQIRIVAERPETLALLQRDQRDLDRALNQAGLGDMARSLSFSLASDQGRQQHQGAAYQGGHRFSGQGQAFDAEGALAPIPHPVRSATSLLDIAV